MGVIGFCLEQRLAHDMEEPLLDRMCLRERALDLFRRKRDFSFYNGESISVADSLICPSF